MHSDLVLDLGVTFPFACGKNKRGNVITLAPYEEKYAHEFLLWYSEDNKDHMQYFVTKGWSPSLKQMQSVYGDSYKASNEYKNALDFRHQKILARTNTMYFFVILENNLPIGYRSALFDATNRKKVWLSSLIGLPENCRQGSAHLATLGMFEILYNNTEIELFAGKIQLSNEQSIQFAKHAMGAEIIEEEVPVVRKDVQGNITKKMEKRCYFELTRSKVNVLLNSWE